MTEAPPCLTVKHTIPHDPAAAWAHSEADALLDALEVA